MTLRVRLHAWASAGHVLMSVEGTALLRPGWVRAESSCSAQVTRPFCH